MAHIVPQSLLVMVRSFN